MAERSLNRYKTLWVKEKLLATSNFCFSHIVFERLVLQTRTNQGLFGKGGERSLNGYKTLWEKEKLLFTSNFSFSHIVFKRLVLQTHTNQGLFGKGLNKDKVMHKGVVVLNKTKAIPENRW